MIEVDGTTHALEEALMAEMDADDSIVLFVTDPPRRVLERFGPRRAVAIPIAEPSVTGLCVGAALSGLRPIFLWRNVTFGFGSYDQLVNQAAKIHSMLGGQASAPMVIWATYGAGSQRAAQHMQTPFATYASVPGLKVCAPSSASSAYSAMRQALTDPDPVMLLQGSRLPEGATSFPEPAPPTTGWAPQQLTRGEKLTVVSVGHSLALTRDALQAAGAAESADLFDLVWLNPFDPRPIAESVLRTGRLVVVEEAPRPLGMGAEVVAAVTELVTWQGGVVHAVERVAAAPVPIPYAPVLESAVVPGPADVEAAIRSVLERSASTAGGRR